MNEEKDNKNPSHVWLTEEEANYSQMINATDFKPEKGYMLPLDMLTVEQRAKHLNQSSTSKKEKLYTRTEVQRWRADVANAAADIVEKVSPSFGGGDWSWLVNDIRLLGKPPLGKS